MSRTGPARIISFYSFKGGAGRTMAVANIAWVLAGAGKAVLAVDWDLEAPGLHRYFQPYLIDQQLTETSGVLDMFQGFVDAARTVGADQEDLSRLHAEHANMTRHVVGLEVTFPGEGRLDYLSPGQQNASYPNRLAKLNWNDFHRSEEGAAYIEALRGRMRESIYDYVLIDSRAGLSDGAAICTQMLPDTVVIGLALNSQSISGGARVARSVRAQAGREIGIHVVPMHVETSELQRLALRKAETRQTFGPVLGFDDEAALDRYLWEVQIPYKPFYALGEELAVFWEEPSDSLGLLAQYVKLAERLTDGEVTGFDWAPESVRRRWHELTHPAVWQRKPETSVILHAPEDQNWADWIGHVMGRGGIRVIARSAADGDAGDLPETDSVVVVLSSALHGSPDDMTVTRLFQGAPVTADRNPTVIGVRVSGTQLLPWFEATDALNLVGLPEPEARRAFLGRLGLSESDGRAMTGPPGSGPRYPSRRPDVWNVPSRNNAFTGRADILAALRTGFDRGDGARNAQALHGMVGVGKREVAREYAHRFGSEYDVVWWIPAGDPQRIQASLTELARAVNRASGTRTGDDWESLRDDLRRGRPYDRWLLIFVDAGEHEMLEPYIPSGGPGHVLVTSRSNTWERHADSRRLDVFSARESAALLRHRLPRAADDDLARLAEVLGHHPSAEDTAAAFLRNGLLPIGDYVERIQNDDVTLLAERSGDGLDSEFAAPFHLAFQSLEQEAPAAGKLLDLCAFLSPEGVSLRIIKSPAMLRRLAEIDSRLQDGMRLHNLLTTLANRALAEVDQAEERIKVHRLIQDLRRSRMDEETRDRTRREVLDILAAMDPGDANCDALRYEPVYAELDKHLLVSGALDSDDPGVRRWVVNQVRYRWRCDQWTSARDLGLSLLAAWRDRFDGDGSTLRLATQVANAHRSLGEYDKAHALDAATLRTQRRLLGRRDPYTLMTARGYAAGLRAVGAFADGLAEDQETLAGFREQFDDDHPDTLNASANLALSWFLSGAVEEALRQDQVTFEGRRRVLTEAHRLTWKSHTNIGTYQREAGLFEDSLATLDEARNRLNRIDGSDSPLTLRAVRSLGMTYLRLGDLNAATQLYQEALISYRRQWGDDHPDTMACVLAVAAGLHSKGRHAEAADYTRDVLERYVRVFDDRHPFTDMCRVNLALYALESGATDEATSVGRVAASQLSLSVGPDHRFTLVARMNYVNCLVAGGESQVVLVEDDKIHEQCVPRWGPDHPITLTAAANLAHSRPREPGDVDPGTEPARRCADLLGAGHPLARALAARPYRRIGAELEVTDI
ncbi:FxSxx-COOH system tetratricopeptide repeat protein [Streptomyces sp. NBC_01803]|uniref:FxSxx-COOH system tetratricopeptide repeat protein n=1 Tax=Streptomyces sp. NBC_01803 TaxID=2975946 RepID=UPI002DDB7803|nr:FxSxx-COOH system tetratricopeptide repeat protein [Streptomyces sp. NBC_01803]WSA44240.1 FxSxx-COOH system tetratricopeptide repeat protein [Streptomyces sp. NBC_01803]